MPESLPGATTALREELEREKARADAAEARAEKALAQRLVFDEALLREKEALAAARRKQGELWELLREARLALVHWAETAEMPLLARIEAALAAPAAGRDPAIEGADAAWRDGEAHGRDK